MPQVGKSINVYHIWLYIKLLITNFMFLRVQKALSRHFSTLVWCLDLACFSWTSCTSSASLPVKYLRTSSSNKSLLDRLPPQCGNRATFGYSCKLGISLYQLPCLSLLSKVPSLLKHGGKCPSPETIPFSIELDHCS